MSWLAATKVTHCVTTEQLCCPYSGNDICSDPGEGAAVMQTLSFRRFIRDISLDTMKKPLLHSTNPIHLG